MGTSSHFSFTLAPHAFACLTRDHAVILDLRSDKYLAISIGQSSALASHVRYWPSAPLTTPLHSEADVTPLLNELLDAGILACETDTGQLLREPAVSPAQEALIETILIHTLDESTPSPARVSLLDVFRFLLAYRRATSRLANCGIEQSIKDLRARKDSGRRSKSRTASEYRRLVTKFRLIRPFVYSAEDQCLKDALVLLDFMSRYRMYPTLVFGIQTKPFYAHCWVQEDGLVFNDTPSHVGTFTSIMSV